MLVLLMKIVISLTMITMRNKPLYGPQLLIGLFPAIGNWALMASLQGHAVPVLWFLMHKGLNWLIKQPGKPFTLFGFRSAIKAMTGPVFLLARHSFYCRTKTKQSIGLQSIENLKVMK